VYVFVAGILMVSAAAMAADLYSMDMELCLPAPDSYPVSIQIDMHKGKEPANLKGTTSADFDGTVLSNIACDALMCITGATESDGMLCITYESIGYKEGKYEADTYFEAFVGDVQTGLHMHTSCSQDIFLDHPYGGLPFPRANFLVREADGTCDIYDRQGCVPNPYKIQWLFVRFEVPCTTVPADLHLTLFKDSSDYRGESVAHFDGTELSGVFSRGKDDKHPATAILHDAQIVGDEMFVWFYVYGHKGNAAGRSTWTSTPRARRRSGWVCPATSSCLRATVSSRTRARPAPTTSPSRMRPGVPSRRCTARPTTLRRRMESPPLEGWALFMVTVVDPPDWGSPGRGRRQAGHLDAEPLNRLACVRRSTAKGLPESR
jgi:hypothetical protein